MISDILRCKALAPGHAGNLKGKLTFAASQLWGKVGHALLLALSNRQYALEPKSQLKLHWRNTLWTPH